MNTRNAYRLSMRVCVGSTSKKKKSNNNNNNNRICCAFRVESENQLKTVFNTPLNASKAKVELGRGGKQ